LRRQVRCAGDSGSSPWTGESGAAGAPPTVGDSRTGAVLTMGDSSAGANSAAGVVANRTSAGRFVGVDGDCTIVSPVLAAPMVALW
jgi:hypothetical protein